MPLRGELLSLEGLEERAKTLAAGFTLAPASRAGGHDVLPRLDENLRVLGAAYRALADDVHRGVAVAPAAEWLLDNFHLVESEARAVRRDLPAALLPDAAEARGARALGQGAHPRAGARADPPRRRAARRRAADPLRPRLPDRGAADDRRALGAAQHAQARAAREPAAS